MPQTLRKTRLRLAWVLAPPFLLLARPTSSVLLGGLVLALPGLLLRALAAARIHKERALAVTGPYARLRHPLYLGSFFVGTGLAVAGGRWFFPLLFAVVFASLYGGTVREEEKILAERFGDRWRRYRDAVPSFLPRWTAWRPSDEEAAGDSPGHSDAAEPPLRPGLPLYRRNKEWEAALGTGIGFALLWGKMILRG